jgi:hypothetical protein
VEWVWTDENEADMTEFLTALCNEVHITALQMAPVLLIRSSNCLFWLARALHAWLGGPRGYPGSLGEE